MHSGSASHSSVTTHSPFIQRITIQHFLGEQTLDWQLQKTNVLVGANGSGKSTILRLLRALFISSTAQDNTSSSPLPEGAEITVTFDDNSVIQWHSHNEPPEQIKQLQNQLHVVYLATFDAQILAANNIPNREHHTQLDMLLTAEINQFKSYQLRLNHHLRQQCRDASALGDFITLEQHIFSPLRHFESLCRTFFASSGKRFETLEDGGIVFDHHGLKIAPWQLSSGEKQLLLLLLNALNHSERPTIFLLDEPEISLHLAWQEKLLDALHQINPDSQIIVATHSPAIVMDGWMDSEVDIKQLLNTEHDTPQTAE